MVLQRTARDVTFMFSAFFGVFSDVFILFAHCPDHPKDLCPLSLIMPTQTPESQDLETWKGVKSI